MALEFVRLTLPYPVSANRYWQSHVIGNHANVHRSKEAEAFRRDVGWRVKQQGWREPSAAPIEIGSITLIPPATVLRMDTKTALKTRVRNGTRMDLDNCLKVTLDALKGIVYADDAQIERIAGPIEYGTRADPGALIIEVRELPIVEPDLFKDSRGRERVPRETLPEKPF